MLSIREKMQNLPKTKLFFEKKKNEINWKCLFINASRCVYIQGVLLPDQQTLRGDSRHEDKHYEIRNHGLQTSSVSARGQ